MHSRFKNMMAYNKKTGVYTVDCSYLNAVEQDQTPRVSMRCLDDKRRLEAKQSADLRRKISTNSCYLRIGGGGASKKASSSSAMSLATQDTSLQSTTDLSGTPTTPHSDNAIIGGGVSMVPNPAAGGRFHGGYESDEVGVEEETQQSKL